jgi:hypothetical protein
LHGALLELGLKFTADAVAHSKVTEMAGGLRFETPRDFKISMQEGELRKGLERLGVGQMKIQVEFVDSEPDAEAEPGPAAEASTAEAALRERVLADPEVQRFQKVFGGQIRGVRSLKDLA